MQSFISDAKEAGESSETFSSSDNAGSPSKAKAGYCEPIRDDVAVAQDRSIHGAEMRNIRREGAAVSSASESSMKQRFSRTFLLSSCCASGVVLVVLPAASAAGGVQGSMAVQDVRCEGL